MQKISKVFLLNQVSLASLVGLINLRELIDPAHSVDNLILIELEDLIAQVEISGKEVRLDKVNLIDQVQNLMPKSPLGSENQYPLMNFCNFKKTINLRKTALVLKITKTKLQNHLNKK